MVGLLCAAGRDVVVLCSGLGCGATALCAGVVVVVVVAACEERLYHDDPQRLKEQAAELVEEPGPGEVHLTGAGDDDTRDDARNVDNLPGGRVLDAPEPADEQDHGWSRGLRRWWCC